MAIEQVQVEELFEAARGRTNPAERATYLDAACGGDAELREQVESLLKAHDEASGFLATIERPKSTDSGAVPLREGPGSTIDRYKLLQQIGEGGFGTVFLAEQEQPVRRRVALKIIKLGMDTKQVVARFAAERQALAIMDHPNIAKVLDGGATESGRPYFVMELVRGVPITTYCDTNNLTVPERLELFVQVCQAVQHAHQKGIIHRDLKPSNVMVMMADGRPMPKVIDFGIAKATDQRLTEKTIFTEFRQMVGTPEYMSPEQAEMAGIDIDTRSDIYSLGVLLYELLVGSTPFDPKELRSKAYAEMQRIIREVEPPRPSTKLSSLGGGLASIAAHRRIEPAKLGTILHGELDWVVMRALEKDRMRRYETAQGLAADVRRYLADEAVEACPPSAGYRLRKFLRRNKGPVLAAAAVLLAVLIGAGISAWQAVRATQAEATALAALDEKEKAREAAVAEKVRAEQEKRRADGETAISLAVNDFLEKDLLGRAAQGGFAGGPDLPPDRNITARALIDRAARNIGDRFSNQPAVEAGLRLAIANSYVALGDVERSLPHWRRAAELKAIVMGKAHGETLALWLTFAETSVRADRRDEALPVLDGVRKLIDEVTEPSQKNWGILFRLSADYRQIGRTGDADRLLEQYLATRPRPEVLDSLTSIREMFALATIYRTLNKPDMASRLFDQAKDAVLRLARDESLDAVDSLFALADQFRRLDRPTEAIPIYLRARDLSVRKTGVWPERIANLGYAYMEAGQPADAIPIWEEICRKHGRNGPYSDELLNNRSVLAICYCRDGRPSDAIPVLEEVRDAYVAAEGPDGNDVVATAMQLGNIYCDLNRWKDAVTILEVAVPKFRAKYGLDLSNTLLSIHNLARCYRETGMPIKALPLLQELVDFERTKLTAHPPDRRALENLVALYGEMGKRDEAIGVLRKASDKSPLDAPVLKLLGDQFARQGKWKEAAPIFARAYELKPDDHGLILSAAVTPLAAGERDGYDRVCRKALEQFGGTDEPVAADRTAKVGLLVARPADNVKPFARMAEIAVEKGARHSWLHYFQLARGMAAYRTGDWAGALDWCGRSRHRAGNILSLVALDLLFEAMAHHRLNQADQARAAMDRATQLINKYLAAAKDDRGDDWHDWLMCEIVRREAESLLVGASADDAPKNDSNRSAPTATDRTKSE
jgi:serine/threonine protein kinase/Flp pilus assembly protein TadD